MLLASLITISAWWRYFCKYFQILDKPGPDVPKRDRVPTIQGVGVMLCFIFGIIYLYQIWSLQDLMHPSFYGLYLWAGLIFLVTLCDEMGRIFSAKLRVSSKIRLLVQILVWVIAFSLSNVWIYSIPLPWLENIVLSDGLALVMTIAWFVLYMNAINWFDGVYGLASGVATIGFWMMFGLLLLVVFPSYALVDQLQISILSNTMYIALLLAMIGSLYMVIEYKPWGLLRDVWTMLFGFLLAYISLVGGAKIGSMIVVLALPIFDAVWVIVDRLRQKKNPMQGDYSHLHYRLMALGRDRHEVRWFIRWYSFVMMVLMLLQGTDKMGKLIIFVMMFLIFFGVNMYLFWIKKLPSVYKPEVRKDNNDEV